MSTQSSQIILKQIERIKEMLSSGCEVYIKGERVTSIDAVANSRGVIVTINDYIVMYGSEFIRIKPLILCSQAK